MIDISQKRDDESEEDFERRRHAGGYFDTESMATRDDLGRNHPSSPFFDRQQQHHPHSPFESPDRRADRHLSSPKNQKSPSSKNKKESTVSATAAVKRGVSVVSARSTNSSNLQDGGGGRTPKSSRSRAYSARSEDIDYSIYEQDTTIQGGYA